MSKLTRETRAPLYPAFLLGLVGFALGWFITPRVVVNNQLPAGTHYTAQPLCNGGLCPGLQDEPIRRMFDSGDVGASSTTKVDNIDIAGTTAAHGLVTLFSGITGLPTNSCAAGSATTSISTTGTASCSPFVNAAGTGLQLTGSSLAVNITGASCAAGTAVNSISSTGTGACATFFNTAGDHLSSSGSTVALAQIASSRFLGRVSAGPGNVEDLTGTQATSLLDTVTIAAKGLAPTLPNDATKYLDGTGNYTVPPGSGGTVTSVSAGTSISVTGTATAPVVNLNFPTTACSAGQAVTSHNSAGTPSCSTFFNTAGSGLTSSTNTVSLNITPTTCASGEALTAISSLGVGTCTAVGALSSPQWIFGNGADGTLTFNCSTTPLAGATLSGSTYTMTRDIFCHNCTLNASCNITGQYRIYDDATFTLNGIIHSTAGSLPASEAGGAGGSSAGGAAGGGIGTGSTAPRECTAATAGPAANGSACGGGGGGAGAGGVGASGGAVALSAATSGDIRSWFQAPLGRQGSSSVYQTASGGGGGRGDAGNVKVGGGGGGAAGYRYVAMHKIVGTGEIDAKGGNGADGQTAGNTGGGGGGGGGYINVVIGTGSCPTTSVVGGTHGAGQGTGTNGGDGGSGFSHCYGP